MTSNIFPESLFCPLFIFYSEKFDTRSCEYVGWPAKKINFCMN